jgi:aspartyl-tRNA synthetase
MDRYGSDKPDLRYDMELVDVSELVSDSDFGVFTNCIENGGIVKAISVPRAGEFSRSQIDTLTEKAKTEGAGGMPYMAVESGQLKGSITKFFSEEILARIKVTMKAEDGDLIIFGSDKQAVVNKVLGSLRIYCADLLGLKNPDVVALAWIVDFPFYETDEKTGKLDFGHNPFSMPKGGVEALNSEDKLSIVADQYDMVMNGYEICSGAVRNHNPEVMYAAFGMLGFDPSYVEQKFGAMLNAFKYGAPPHAGCAFGLDRIFMVLMGEENIREVIAFPKNGSGIDVMMNSPSSVDGAQLKELNLKHTL